MKKGNGTSQQQTGQWCSYAAERREANSAGEDMAVEQTDSTLRLSEKTFIIRQLVWWGGGVPPVESGGAWQQLTTVFTNVSSELFVLFLPHATRDAFNHILQIAIQHATRAIGFY